MSTARSLPLLLARWFEARLHESYVPHWPLARLYAVDVIDPEALDRLDPTAARVSFLAEAPSVAALADMPDARLVREHDGAIVVDTRWVAVPSAGVARPGEFARRRRARVVQVATDHGTASVARFDDDPDLVVLSPAA